MSDFTKMLEELKAVGMSDSEVARVLTARGVSVTQPTITRIRRGQFKRTGYELGTAIKKLHAERIAGAGYQRKRGTA